MLAHVTAQPFCDLDGMRKKADRPDSEWRPRLRERGSAEQSPFLTSQGSVAKRPQGRRPSGRIPNGGRDCVSAEARSNRLSSLLRAASQSVRKEEGRQAGFRMASAIAGARERGAIAFPHFSGQRRKAAARKKAVRPDSEWRPQRSNRLSAGISGREAGIQC